MHSRGPCLGVSGRVKTDVSAMLRLALLLAIMCPVAVCVFSDDARGLEDEQMWFLDLQDQGRLTQSVDD